VIDIMAAGAERDRRAEAWFRLLASQNSLATQRKIWVAQILCLEVGSGRCHSYAREYCPPHGDEEVFVTRGRRRLRRSRLYQALLNLILSHQELNLYPFVGIINVDRHLPAIQMSDVAISDGIEFFGKQEVKTVLNR
jgi:hypothetical protein